VNFDAKLLAELAKREDLGGTISVGTGTYVADSIRIAESETPVNRPTSRGGVYFAGKTEFRAKVQVSDLRILTVLSGAMLGPNTDFEKILLTVCVTGSEKINLVANLASYVQKKSGLELNLVIINTGI
jgi:hypothetical protein